MREVGMIREWIRREMGKGGGEILDYFNLVKIRLNPCFIFGGQKKWDGMW